MDKKNKKVNHPKKKGTKYELSIVKQICENQGLVYGEDLRRRWAGEKGNDIVHMSKKSFDIFPFSLEVKNRRRWELHSWWEQTVENTGEGMDPLLIFHDHGTSKDFALIDFKVLLKLIEILKHTEKGP